MSLALILLETRKPKSSIMLQTNGMLLQIIHLVLEASKYRIRCSYNPLCFILRISYYATSSTENSVYIIGGYIASPSSTPIIAEYQNDEWHNVGNLKQARIGHGAITSGSLTMVIGGYDYDSQP